MRVNAVKCALAQGKLQLGTGLWQLRSVEIPRMLAAAGFHWVFVDTEHGGLDTETVQDLCRVSNMAGLCPVVRVTDMQYPLVARALDCGAQGVVFPRVESPELLEKAISWAKFPPLGMRGFGLSSMQIDYESAGMPEIIEHMNANSMIVLQIETRRAVEARDDLLSVAGVDAVMVGPADLSVSLGVPGEFQHPRMVEAMEAVRDSCVAHGVAPGTQTRSPSLAKFWKERGMKFLGCSNDWGMLYDRAVEIVSSLNG